MGIGAGVILAVPNPDNYDEVLQVSPENAMRTSREMEYSGDN